MSQNIHTYNGTSNGCEYNGNDFRYFFVSFFFKYTLQVRAFTMDRFYIDVRLPKSLQLKWTIGQVNHREWVLGRGREKWLRCNIRRRVEKNEQLQLKIKLLSDIDSVEHMPSFFIRSIFFLLLLFFQLHRHEWMQSFWFWLWRTYFILFFFSFSIPFIVHHCLQQCS